MKTKMIMAALITALIMGISQKSFAQEMSKQDYLEKSRQQKTAGWILLGGGATLAIVGGALMVENFCLFGCSDTVDNSFNAGTAMAVIGGTAMIASVPMFISSRNNAEKAGLLSIKSQPLNIPRYTGKIPKSYPAISLSIPLN
ncbi:hypothetical protein [Algoriphagus sp. CAU 1675]|uniref:hypothetical protein n=1 Tax=Algoriphagus sp. CAU 1675 TaxID=3032597 RepID=UPI0023DBDB88|nr:hypothetical protein [Algoriphagus sp. CAU 1675]MDF2157595.1 hypothetical protein [Algoriphagus sp. CAU 1675]